MIPFLKDRARPVLAAFHALHCRFHALFHNIELGRNVKFSGRPLLDTSQGGRIVIGNNVTLNSRNRGYHVNMHSPVKLMADRPGATITIGDGTRIHGSCLHAWTSITVGKNCLIAANCQIIDSSGHALSFDNVDNRINTKGTANPITIGDSVWIGADTLILPGTTIGRGSVIGAGSVVTRNIPPMSIAAGNPARVLREAGKDDANP